MVKHMLQIMADKTLTKIRSMGASMIKTESQVALQDCINLVILNIFGGHANINHLTKSHPELLALATAVGIR